MTLPAILAAGNPAADLAGQFHIEWPILIAQALNFGIVAFLLWKFAIKPVTKTLDERNKKIADGLQYAEEMKEKLADAERQHAEAMKQAQQEAQALIEEARKNATAFEEQQRQEAVTRAEQIVEKAHAAIEQDRKKMMEEVRAEVSRLVVLTSGKVLEKELSDADRSRFSESAARELTSVN